LLDNKTINPNTELNLVGMYHSCDTAESIVLGVYRAIYDHHQVTEAPCGLKDGDEIVSEPCKVPVYHSYDNPPTIDVPAMRFTVNSFHIVMETPDYDAMKAACGGDGEYED
jgi:hypothetical protein